MKLFLPGLLGLCFSVTSLAGEILTDFPDTVDPSGRYVFYSHGFIVEGENPTPIHPKYGIYDFPAIKQALSDPGYDLIAYHRPSGTDAGNYSKKLAMQVDELIEAGVHPGNITILGFSRGGMITALASSELKNDNINVIIMAACGGWLENQPEIEIHGRFLSVYETSDAMGSCGVLARRSEKVVSFKEIAISTGKEHGAFFEPIDDWVEPVKSWVLSGNQQTAQ